MKIRLVKHSFSISGILLPMTAEKDVFRNFCASVLSAVSAAKTADSP